jgi:hypothetical protein
MHQNRRRDQNVEHTKNRSRPNLGLMQQKCCTRNFDSQAQSRISESTAAKNATKTCLAGKSAKFRHWMAQYVNCILFAPFSITTCFVCYFIGLNVTA